MITKKLFITGTGTDVGKTFVTGLIVKKLVKAGIKNAYYKAAMSGNTRNNNGVLVPGDAKWIKLVSGIEQDYASMCPFIYEAAVSPHLASRMEGEPVCLNVVKKGFERLCYEYEFVTMEGSGGILCPLRLDKSIIWLEDVIRELNLPCLVVANACLGSINNVVLTLEYMKNKNINVKGIIFNRFHPGNIMEEDNLHVCECRTGVKTVACVKEGENDLNIDVADLIRLYGN